MYKPTSNWYQSNGLKLHYVEWVNPGAPTLLLVHGQMDHYRSWDFIARTLHRNFNIIAVDLRGHGDSEWSTGNSYSVVEHIYDLRQLINQLKLNDITIISHSLGGAISLKYSGIYPEKVKYIIAIEGIGASPERLKAAEKIDSSKIFCKWAEKVDKVNQHTKYNYQTQQEAINRMQQINPNFSVELAQHLTIHGLKMNVNKHYSWKFDPQLRAYHPFDMNAKDTRALWRNITCPVLLVRGKKSWASNPAEDGRVNYFSDVQVVNVPNAAHWVHHDQYDLFMNAVNEFLNLDNYDEKT